MAERWGREVWGSNLPDVADFHDNPTDISAGHLIDRWKVWIDLSRLGNHCLCVERILRNPTPTDLYRALRAAAYYTRGQEFRYQLIRPDGTAPAQTNTRWRSIADFASDAIGLTMPDPRDELAPDHLTGRRHVMGQCYVVAVVTTPAPLGDGPVAIARALARRHGGRLFRVNVNRVASTLAEWLRYPLLKNISSPELGFRDSWIARIDETTLFSALPAWSTRGQLPRFGHQRFHGEAAGGSQEQPIKCNWIRGPSSH